MGEGKHDREKLIASAEGLPVDSHTKQLDLSQNHQYPNHIQQIVIAVFRSYLFFSVDQLSELSQQDLQSCPKLGTSSTPPNITKQSLEKTALNHDEKH